MEEMILNEINQKNIELKWQKNWKNNKTFEVNVNKSKKKFFSTVPYPYGNSSVHIGHGRTFTSADIVTRFHRLKGENVLFPMGFHVSGSPVLAVSDSINRGNSRQLKLSRDAISDYCSNKDEEDKLLEKFKDPNEIAKFFSKTIKKSFESLGLSIDWRREFTTGDDIYQKFIEWQYLKLNKIGVLEQGRYPILYSPYDKNAVGEDDIKDGDTDKVSLSEMTYILFEFKERKNEFVAIATLRPDAIFGTSNLWIDSKEDLLKIKIKTSNDAKEQIWIIAKDALVKFENQFNNVDVILYEEQEGKEKIRHITKFDDSLDNVKVISEHKGLEFINQEVITPLTNKFVPIVDASFLDPNHGTGIAYSSPAGSPHDFIAVKEAKKEGRLSEDVKVIISAQSFDKKKKLIECKSSCRAEDMINKFKITSSRDSEKLELAKQELYKEEHFGAKLTEVTGEFEGLFISKAKDKIKTKMMELNLAGIFYETSRRAVTRAGDKVIVANLDGQWFLNYSREEIKKQAHELLNQMNYFPTKMKDSQSYYLDWVSMRPCARRRGIGTRLPFDKEWIIEPLSDSTIYMFFYLIVHIIKRESLKDDQLKPSLFDYILLKEGSLRVVLDETGINENIIREMIDEIEYWRAFDLRYTNPPHMSNHLSFSIYHHALIFPEKYWPKTIIVAGLLIKDGAKISKSKGNGLPLNKVKDKYGIDLYRLYTGIAANYDVEMDFKDDEILQIEKKFNKFKELILSSIKSEGGKKGMINKALKKYDDFSDINKCLISKFYSKVEEYFKLFEEMRIREAYVPIFYEFLSDINYHERRTNKKEVLEVIRFIAKDYIHLMTPLIPHICEEFNELLANKEYISIAKFDRYSYKKYINKDIEELEEIVENIVSSISSQKEQFLLTNPVKFKEFKKVVLVQASENRFKLFDRLDELLKETREFKKILPILMKEFQEDKKFIMKFLAKTLGSGLSRYLSKKKEKELLMSVLKFLENEFKLKFEIRDSDDKNKLTMSLIPSKPLIIFE